MSTHANIRQSDRQPIPDHGDQPDGHVVHHPRKISRAALIRAWADPRPLPEIAAEFGFSMQRLSAMAHEAGLPHRPVGPKKRGIGGPEFARLWLDGVKTKDLIKLYGCDHLAPARQARRLGLPKRGRGWVYKMTLDDWKADRMREAMAASARETHAALVNAEMLDGWHPHRRVA